ncbi:polar localization protein TipN [Phenylobacterium sp.]|uniref:polar localization protein TipN n=1 Tax=Phenylobacterium sp. TaxID=1871053 RepID=UPI00121BEFA1|nr:polar localization protein TipN [Phenylobacterium sp.]THD63296.1 MAG: polar localization protein TipN [Phenylobacterium sp.]
MRIKKRTRPTDFGASPRPDLAEPEGAADWDAPGHDLADPGPPIAPYASLRPPSRQTAVAAGQPQSLARRPEEAAPERPPAVDAYRPPSAWPIYLVAFAVAALWALAPIAFALGYRNAVAPLRNDDFALAVFALLAIGPSVFVFACAYMIRQGQKLGAEARRAKAAAEEMLGPAIAAAGGARDVVLEVREEIVRAAHAADEARETLMALREALALESERLVESADHSVRTTRELTTTLGRERSEMGALAHSLDAQASRVTDSITQQAKMVAEATELAQTQLREAEAVLSARAADLAAAAGEASDAARTAGEDLTRHIARLETAGAGVTDQVRAVETGLTEQRAALITLAQTLRADHEGFADQAEAHAAKLSEFIDAARVSSAELSGQALKGGESLRALMADAADQFRDLTETARAEREEFGQSTLQSLETVSEAAAQQRAQLEAQTRSAIEALAAAAEETRAAAASHAAAARDQVDQLSEAAFAAGQKANQVFEARLSEARALVEQSSEMVDQAGAATAQRLEEGAAAARASLAALQAMMAEVDRRATQLPANAQDQIDLVRAAVASGLEELTLQARRTAEEAQAIDAAFQDRARRNFEMMSEAVRLMGVSATLPPAPAATAPLPRPAAPPRPVRARPAPPLEPEPTPLALTAADEDDLELEDLMEPAAPVEDPGLRPRLKLTPTATDEEFSALFEAAGGAAAEPPEPAHEGESWTWKDLLASIDGADAEGERLADVLGAELTQMGVEPARLLPKARIDEIAAAVQTGDVDGAREVVKRLAPAATRRIGRRLVTNEAIRRQAQVYVRRYQTLVDDAAVRDPEGFLMASLLGDEAGRLYLLLDAAAGDQD